MNYTPLGKNRSRRPEPAIDASTPLAPGLAPRPSPSIGPELAAFVSLGIGGALDLNALELSLGSVPGVEEIHKVAGEDCYIIKVRSRNSEGLDALISRELSLITGINSIRTTVILKTVKS